MLRVNPMLVRDDGGTEPTDLAGAVRAFAGTLGPGTRILDVGCGQRPYEQYFSHCSYVGVDVEVSGRERDGKNADVFFNGTDLPFEDEKFDAIICTEVLEHAIEPARLVREMRRVLVRNGRVLITVPFIWGEHEVPYDFRRYSTYGIRRLLEEEGLRVVSVSRLTPGIDSIDLLVRSEIVNFTRQRSDAPAPLYRRFARRLAERVAQSTWRLQLHLWRQLYRFERIYIDNQIIAVRTD